MKTVIPLALLLLVACGGEREDAAAAPGAIDDLAGTIDRAEAVEQELLEQKERMDRALDEAEGDPESRPR